jgi:hypothetical protein
MFGNTLPSHGFFIRHAKNIHMSNVEIACAKDDLRPAFVLQEVKGADFFRVRTPRVADTPTFALKKIADFSVSQSRPVPDAQIESMEEKKL